MVNSPIDLENEKPSLFNLSTELILLILRQDLDVIDILHIAEICRRFHDIVRASEALQHRILLHASCVIDGSSQNRDTASRLRMLRNYRYAWCYPRGTSAPCPDEEFGALRQHQVKGGTMVVRIGLQAFQIFQLPTPVMGVKENVWNTWSIETNSEIALLAIDPTQDLLVGVQMFTPTQIHRDFHLHLRSLSTGHPHPATNLRCNIPINAQPAFAVEKVSGLTIMGNHVGLLFHSREGNQIHIFNWCGGGPKKVINGPIQSFTFLSPDIVLIAVAEPSLTPQLSIIDLSKHPDSNFPIDVRVNSIYSFKWPERLSEVQSTQLRIHPNNALHPPATETCANNVRPPFLCNPDDNVYCITLTGFLDDNFFQSHLIVSRRTLLYQHPRSCGYSEWADWASKTYSLIENPLSICGPRVLVKSLPSYDRRYHILNFSKRFAAFESLRARRSSGSRSPRSPRSPIGNGHGFATGIPFFNLPSHDATSNSIYDPAPCPAPCMDTVIELIGDEIDKATMQMDENAIVYRSHEKLHIYSFGSP